MRVEERSVRWAHYAMEPGSCRTRELSTRESSAQIDRQTDREAESEAGGQRDSRTIMRWVICHAADRRKLASVA